MTAIGETLERPLKANSLLARNYGDPIDLSVLAKNSPVKDLLEKRKAKEEAAKAQAKPSRTMDPEISAKIEELRLQSYQADAETKKQLG